VEKQVKELLSKIVGNYCKQKSITKIFVRTRTVVLETHIV
jgi:hydroxymethylglutaryl-CoA reductase